jgi:cellulose synthase/poly-beta-1,6-N-acetylglucosamine synthase-like glycosyltransferase
MTEIAIALFGCLMLWIITRILQVKHFLKSLHAPPNLPAPGQQFSPNATVILCLRGADPLLEDCLQGLFQQDYPNYQVRIIVDHQQDPAWSVVNQFLDQQQSTVPIKLSVLEKKSPTCGLKCSAILQAIADLDPACEVVAFMDADTMAHPTWLHELVMPLHDPQVGASSGNRWYLPDDAQWGSLVRHLWNVTAVIMMQTFHIPWGGSLAIKTHVLYESGLPKLWERSLVEDTPIYQALNAKGWRIEFVSSLFIINRESCDLFSFLRWSQRQSLFGRLYHPAWLFMFAHAAANLLLLLSVVGVLLVALFKQQWVAFEWLGTGLFTYILALAAMADFMDKNVRSVVKKRGEKLSSVSVVDRLRLIVAIPFCILVCGLATLLTQGLRRVQWRGVVYQIQDAWAVRLVEYTPYKKIERPTDPMASL